VNYTSPEDGASAALALGGGGAPTPPLGQCGISEVCNLAAQEQTFADFPWLDGLWYWGCSPSPDVTISCFNATLTAARAAGKWAAGAVSATYSAHSRGTGWYNNRYTHSAGGKGPVDVWQAHIATQMDLVIFTTWNDLGEHHYMGPANKTDCGHDDVTKWVGCPNWQTANLTEFPPWTYGEANWTHLGFLELAAAFIPWYKSPPGSPMPPITPESEAGFYFYNLQSFNNSCPGDPVGSSTRGSRGSPNYPIEDAVYLHMLLASPANATITSGTAPGVLFPMEAGINYVKTLWSPGKQSFRVERAGVVLADVTGTQAINTTAQSMELCSAQTFSGVIKW
jgi:hypothetical protein